MADHQNQDALDAMTDEDIISLMNFVDQVGGIDEARAAMEALSELKNAA